MYSAIFSNRALLLDSRSDKKDKKQLAIKRIIAVSAISSTTVFDATFKTFSEVRTIKQMPSKFEEVFKICGDLSFAIIIIYMKGTAHKACNGLYRRKKKLIDCYFDVRPAAMYSNCTRVRRN